MFGHMWSIVSCSLSLEYKLTVHRSVVTFLLYLQVWIRTQRRWRSSACRAPPPPQHHLTFYQLCYKWRMSEMFSFSYLSLQSTPHFQSAGVQCLCCIYIPTRACNLGVTSFLMKQSGKNGSEMADYFRQSGEWRTQADSRQIASFST